MKKYKYKKIDAFTSENSLGNPAACIFFNNEESLTSEEMLAIARQHKGFVSEVVYMEPSKYADCKLTYYSSECEVDFCGHGTIAAMYSYIEGNPDIFNKRVLQIETNRKGVLAVMNKINSENAIFITAPYPKYMQTILSKEEVACELGISSDEIMEKYPLDVINAGLNTLIVPISKLKTEISLFPKEDSLKQFCEKSGIDIILIYSLDVKNNDNIAHTRVFAPKFGYLEDPATGSGNSAFGYYMLKYNIWKGESVSIEQGGIDREFNTIKLMHDGTNVLFGGNATTRIEGIYFV